MEKEDGRKLTRQAQHERRKQAVRLHRRGMVIKDIADALGMAQGTVRSAIKVADKDGIIPILNRIVNNMVFDTLGDQDAQTCQRN